MKLNNLINELINYGQDKRILEQTDINYSVNQILELFHENEYHLGSVSIKRSIDDILDDFTKLAILKGLILSQNITMIDNFKAKVINLIMDRPKVVIDKFYHFYSIKKELATNYLYQLSIDTNYIQTSRIKKNIIWSYDAEYGKIILTINLSKPEKDPQAIILQLEKNKLSDYPKCQLCKENEGYHGSSIYDSRANMRIIPITLDNEDWYFQYSPYSYFNEHAIVLKKEHTPMMINQSTFRKLIMFLDMFPTYFIGSNAGLPIVGGSILNHEHFQAGKYHFPIEDAKTVFVKKMNNCFLYKLNWPLSTIRISSPNKEDLINLAFLILDKWENYQNDALMIYNSKDNLHNTITPIARIENNNYVFDLILRNNATNESYPDGIFHPHRNLHHIKKENIGLIEAMGLGILPGRLKNEFDLIREILLGNENLELDSRISKHQEWIKILKNKFKKSIDVEQFILNEAGMVFSLVLEDAGVFKMNQTGEEAFFDFINNL